MLPRYLQVGTSVLMNKASFIYLISSSMLQIMGPHMATEADRLSSTLVMLCWQEKCSSGLTPLIIAETADGKPVGRISLTGLPQVPPHPTS